MLFDEDTSDKNSELYKSVEPPLADKMRPKSGEGIFGQEDIWNSNSALFNMVESGTLQSFLFWGPPGSGKTSLAGIIGKKVNCPLTILSAVKDGVKEIRAAIELSEKKLSSQGRPHLLFLDEVHRLNKNQQDVLLPAIEYGTIYFIGATTENPSFELNKALLSRCIVFSLKEHTKKSIYKILENTIQSIDSEIKVANEVLLSIAENSFGDARRALNILEALLTIAKNKGTNISLATLNNSGMSGLIPFDKKGEEHYDIISALIKSIRASHPDAALYYLARLLDGGEDVNFISRRLVISASEDIGNANPHCLNFAQSAASNARFCGMPEARIILSQLVTLLASSPKSNASYLAINSALDEVNVTRNLSIPLHLRNAPTKLMKDKGYGEGYVYAHDNLDEARKKDYFPIGVKNRSYYQPKDEGYEANIKKTLKKIKPIEQ